MIEHFKIEQLDLVFGKNSKKVFQALDAGQSREHIHQELKHVIAVQNVNFSVYKSEILVIMGLSGSGKSSLLRCLNGMNGRTIGKTRGQILYLDAETNQRINLIECPKNHLRKIRKHQVSMVFQQFGLMPWRTVSENVAFPLEIQGIKSTERIKQVEEKLEIVGLAKWKSHYPHELSGGMQQRVGLARAFVTQADVLLMDEPFSALDPLIRKQLQDEILELQQKFKKTIIFVTHDFSEAIKIGSRIAIMDAGKILQIGTPQDIIENPACENVKRFTEDIKGTHTFLT
ncbi:ATP-binding cassette domain-containing protein [Fluviispira multicolorata]|uniref:ATP-binding cassette domain-containing protein n=1 Tax=Fluviispira multicolorata TaxID=2654512 RepID=A0A833JEM0_9BACT|nr:ATP-binding cassette domain-containing protein [Fluviispira multicolorata]KAB8033269.1 ATP-binding cassette domain-containing protein [Fluviispira multicolorata]